MDYNQRIVFMGTPEIAANVLQALIENEYNIVGVIAQPDKPIGRKKILEPVPTKKVALKHGIPVFQPYKIKLDYEFLKELKPDLIITLAYGQIVPQGVLDIPPLGCINLHGSLLPKYRGAAPIQYAIKNGDKITGVTLMEMIDKMDAGKMYAKKTIAISDDDNSSSLFNKIGECAKELILETLPLYLEGKLNGEEQDESLVSFCPTIKPEEEHIPPFLKTYEFVNYVRFLADQPGAYLLLDDLKFKIYKAKVYSNNKAYDNYKIIQADKNGLLLTCSDGVVQLLEIQKQGKNRMDYKSFVNGEKDILGKILQ